MTDDLAALRAAKALLQRTSWDPAEEALNDKGEHIMAVWPAKSYSLVGAIINATTGDAKLCCKLVIDVLGSGSMGLTSPQSLNHWEAEPGRTVEDVHALLDRAIYAREITTGVPYAKVLELFP